MTHNQSARPTLQAFQAELARKLAESAQRPATAGWLGVSWHGVRALLPLGQAGEIFNPTPMQRVPHTQPWVMGVASLRGTVSVIVDWVRFLGLPAQAQTPGSEDTVYWVSFNPAIGVAAALCVDQLLGLHAASDLMPEDAGASPPGVRQFCRDAAGHRWLELDLVALAQSPEFLDPRSTAFARLSSPLAG